MKKSNKKTFTKTQRIFLSGSLYDVKKEIQKLINKYGASAKLLQYSYDELCPPDEYGYGFYTQYIEYEHKETDSEYNTRLKRERLIAEKELKRERLQYEYLKKKFEHEVK